MHASRDQSRIDTYGAYCEPESSSQGRFVVATGKRQVLPKALPPLRNVALRISPGAQCHSREGDSGDDSKCRPLLSDALAELAYDPSCFVE
jgi:hypothetical protein